MKIKKNLTIKNKNFYICILNSALIQHTNLIKYKLEAQ